MKTNIITNNTVMKGYLKYLCAVLLLIGTSAHAWAADPSAPSANYTLIKSVSSLSTNDRVILYCPANSTAVSGLSTCNSTTDASMSSTAQMWVEYKVTVVDASTIKLQDTRLSSNNYVYNNSGKFQYTSSGSATALSITSGGVIKDGTSNLNAKDVGTGSCTRASARFTSGGSSIYVFKVVSAKESKYSVSTTSAELSITIDDDEGGMDFSSGELVRVTTTAGFVGAIYAELTGFSSPDVISESIYTTNSNDATNGFIINTANGNNGVYVKSWSLGGDLITNGTYQGYIHVYPHDGTNTTDEFYIPLTITVVNGSDGCTPNTVLVADAGSNTSTSGNYGTLTSVSLTVLQDGTGNITWTSSNTNVATVSGNNSSATVTIVGAGTTTIKASAAADATYCTGEGTYSVTVNAIAPTLSHNATGKALTAGSITSTGVTLSGGVVTAKGGSKIASYGFVVGTSSSVNYGSATKKPKIASSDISLNTAFGSASVTGLSPNTTYYVKAYATNEGPGSNKTGYSNYISFATLAQYTISYDANGGSGTVSSQTVDAGGSVTVKDGSGFSLTGHTLSGWKLDNASSGTAYSSGDTYSSISANHTFYAQWTPNEYTITLDNQSATSPGTESITVTYGASTNLTGNPAITIPTRTGYTFGGYYTGTNGTGGQIITAAGVVNTEANDGVEYYTDEYQAWIYAGNKTLYAKWTANEYTINLNGNSATTAGTASVDATYGSSTLSSAITNPEKTDKEFAGWYSGEGGTGSMVISTSGQLKENVDGYTGAGGIWTKTSGTTLYAKWVNAIVTVTYNMHGVGVAPADEDVESGIGKATKPEDPYVEDYHFLGWFTDDGAGNATNTEFNFASTITGNTTIHAKWEDVTYSTTYKAWCEPDITISGDIHLTSVNGVYVQSTSTTNNLLRIQSSDLSGVTKLDIKYLNADDGDSEVASASSLFRLCNDGVSPDNYNTADGSQIDVSGSNTCNLTYSIRYTPNAYNVINHYKLQITMKRGTRAVKTVTHDLYGRSLPEEFVIAAKNNNDNQWYALPNTIVDNNNAISPTRITVDNTTTPTKAKYAPSTTVYKGAGRYASGTNVYGIGFTTDGTDQFKIRKNSNYVYLSTTGSAKYQDFYLESTNGSAYEAYRITVPSDDSSESDKELGIDRNNFGYFKDATVDAIFILPIQNKLVEQEASAIEWGRKSVVLDVDAQAAFGAQAHIGDGAIETATSFGQTLTSVKEAASKYNYTVSFSTTDFSTHKGELLYIDWLDEEENVLSTSMITIPWIIATDTKMNAVSTDKDAWAAAEVHVLPGITLEANGGDFSYKTVAIKQLEIYPGATVKITKGDNDRGTLNPTTLVLRNGWTRAGSKEYDVARLYITDNGTLTKPTNTYADWYIDYDQYYPVAVPWEVTTSEMTYLNSSNSASAGVKLRYYDGASRADNGQTGVGSGVNWKEYSPLPTTLYPGKGYAMTARRPTGKAFSIVRMPLTIPSTAWTTSGEKGAVSTTHKDEVAVIAHGAGLGKPTYTVGWNFIANPYMALYQGDITHSVDDDYDVAYVNIPDIEFKNYGQYPVGEDMTKLKPASGFFVQAEADGTLTFGETYRKAEAPAYRNETKAPAASKQKAYIVLNDDTEEDMMGLIIADKYSADYEINADLEKLLGDANTLKTYMRYGDMNMAYVAINGELAKEWIPVTVQIPAGGVYTFALHEASSVAELEGVYLIDYANANEITNLLESNYSFGSGPGTISNRFAINATVGNRTPTDIDAINAGGEKDSSKPIKFLWHDNVYVLYNGVIYDATGKKVREINK